MLSKNHWLYNPECLVLGEWLLWLSGSLSFFFLYSSSIYYFHLFLISSASIGPLPFLSFIVPIFGWSTPLIFPVFLKSSLVFPLLLLSSISLYCSLKKAFLSFLAILWDSAFFWLYLSLYSLPFTFLLSSAVCKAFSDNHFAFFFFLLFFFFRMYNIIDLCP